MASICAFLIMATGYAAPYTPRDEIKEDGEWRLVTVVLLKNTRSQKIIGKIEYRGREVLGTPNHTLITPFGSYTWRAPYDQGYRSGWISNDSDLDVTESIPAEVDINNDRMFLHTKERANQGLLRTGDPRPARQYAEP